MRPRGRTLAVAAALSVYAVVAMRTEPARLAGLMDDICGTLPLFSTPVGASGDVVRPATVVKPLSCEPLADVPGKSTTTALVHFPPGAHTGAHRHPGSVSAFVVSGAIRSQLAGMPAKTYTAGETWFEPPRALHLFADNDSTQLSATLLVTFIADANCGPLVIPEPGQ
jgi:quercetin dioxygenase-like cupin family protein